MRWPVVLKRTFDGGDDDVAGHHSKGTGNEKGLSTKSIQIENGGECEQNLENSSDSGC